MPALASLACPPDSRFRLLARTLSLFRSLSLTGESGLGKSTLINTLFATELVTLPQPPYAHRFAKQLDKTTEVEIIKAELQEREFGVRLTVIDTPGFGDYVNNRERWVAVEGCRRGRDGRSGG